MTAPELLSSATLVQGGEAPRPLSPHKEGSVAQLCCPAHETAQDSGSLSGWGLSGQLEEPGDRFTFDLTQQFQLRESQAPLKGLGSRLSPRWGETRAGGAVPVCASQATRWLSYRLQGCVFITTTPAPGPFLLLSILPLPAADPSLQVWSLIKGKAQPHC